MNTPHCTFHNSDACPCVGHLKSIIEGPIYMVQVWRGASTSESGHGESVTQYDTWRAAQDHVDELEDNGKKARVRKMAP